MVRVAREHSVTSIYHVMFRGNGKMDIFLDSEDRRKFLTIMKTKQQIALYEVFGYCLMTNHVHLLVRTGKESIGQSMKRIGISYAHYFNKKYERVGHVFQDRFRSEVIENEGYLLSALRYIHNNPIKGGMVEEPSQYRWSSYHYFMKPSQAEDSFINTQFILKTLSNDTWESLRIFEEFSRGRDDNGFMDVGEKTTDRKCTIKSIKDGESFIKEYLKGVGIKDLKRKDCKTIRNQLIEKLKEESNLSLREIGCLLGVSKNVVGRR